MESAQQGTWPRRHYWLLVGVVAAAALWVDASVELGVAAGVASVAVVLLAMRAPAPGCAFVSAAIGSALVVVGYGLSEPGGESWKVLANRALSIGVIWVTAAAVYQRLKVEREREDHRAVKERLAAIVESSQDAIISRTVDGTITSWNAAAERMYGYSKAEAVGSHVSLIVPPDRRDELQQLLSNVHAGGVQHVETLGLTKHGAAVDVRLTISPMRDAAGQVIGASVISEDITRRRAMEAELVGHQEHLEELVAERTRELRERDEMLRQSQKMEAVGQLAAGVAHDFHNQLSSIIGFVELVQREIAPREEAHGMLKEVVDAAERASALTRQLLAFSRRQILQPSVLNLNEAVERTAAMLQRVIGEHVELETALADELDPVYVDAVQVEQLLMNLALNARDAMPEGGRLTIETANAELDEAYAVEHPQAQPGPHVMLAVSDTGTGMDAETRARIFEPFFTTKPAGEGTGLGLATVYGIAKQSGGNIWVYSEPGRGTTFKVYLPRTTKAPAPARSEALAEHAPATDSETVLLAEDEPGVRRLVHRTLTSAGYTVLACDGATNALEAARQHTGPIHLLLTDVVMPRLNGRELSERLQAERPGLRTLYMSGYTDNTIAQQGQLDEGVDFLEKPLRPATVLAKVRFVLARPSAGPLKRSLWNGAACTASTGNRTGDSSA